MRYGIILSALILAAAILHIPCVEYLYAQQRTVPAAAGARSGNTGGIDFWRFDSIYVDEVLEGDTLLLDNDQVLKLIGVETPDLYRRGKIYADVKKLEIPEEILRVMANEARHAMQQLLEHRYVRVEFDKQTVDQYGVLMGYVFVRPQEESEKKRKPRMKSSQEIFVNAEMIRRGYTPELDTTPNNQYRELFHQLHRQVAQQVKGLWLQWYSQFSETAPPSQTVPARNE